MSFFDSLHPMAVQKFSFKPNCPKEPPKPHATSSPSLQEPVAFSPHGLKGSNNHGINALMQQMLPPHHHHAVQACTYLLSSSPPLS
jgi:hypothetical protein